MTAKPGSLQASVVFRALPGLRLKYLKCFSVVRTLRKRRMGPAGSSLFLACWQRLGVEEMANMCVGAAPDLLECSYLHGASSVVSI